MANSPFIYGPNGAQNLVPNALANNFIENYATTATAAGTTTLTVNSAAIQYFTGTTTQTVVLPVTSTLVTGYTFTITNNSTGIVTVQSSGGNTIISQAPNTTALYTCILTTGTTAASWNGTYLGAGGAKPPTVQVLTSGSGTYTAPSGVLYIQVEMVGGGGGGAGSGTGGGGGASTSGGASTFGPSGDTGLLTAGGGSFASAGTVGGGAGGSYSIGSGPVGGGSSGATGGPGAITISSTYVPGAQGGGLGGGGGAYAQAGTAGGANSGGGGGGGGTGNISGAASGAGGGSGAYLNAIITNPIASYQYSVGSGGSAGTAGTSGYAGGAGGSGIIIVTEFYANGAIGTATTITGSVNSSQVLGTTAGGNAPTGYIGEFISANSAGVAVGSSGSFVTITSISLTAGDWDVEGVCSLVTGGTTAGTIVSGGVSLNANSEDTQASGGVFDAFATLVASSTYLNPTGKRRINVSSTTTVYLVGAVTYTVAGGATWGTNSFIGARRVR